MKTRALLTIAFLFAALLFSFTDKKAEPNEIKITVTSDQPAKFDMYHDLNVQRGLSTPFYLTVNESESKFIFKLQDSNGALKIKVESKHGTLNADWPVTVVLIAEDKMETFGID